MKRLAIIFTLFVTSLFFIVYHAYAWSQYNHVDSGTVTHSGNNPAVVPYFTYDSTDFIGGDTFNRISLKIALTNSQPYVLIYATQGVDIFEDCVTTDGTSNAQVVSATFDNALTTDADVQVQVLGFTQYSNCAPGGNHSVNYSLPVTIYGVADDLGSSIYVSIDGVSVDEFTPWFEFVDGSNMLSIGTPSDGSSHDLGVTTFSGECGDNGPGYALRPSGFDNAPTHVDDFDIECTDFTWSDDQEIYRGLNTYFIYSIDCLDTSREIPGNPDHFYGCFGLANGTTRASSAVTGIDATNGYSLTLIYPKNNEPLGITNITAGTWTFRFRYSLPLGINSSDVDFTVTNCDGDTGWSTCASTVVNGTVASIDTLNQGLLDTDQIEVEAGVYHYFIATLDVDSAIKYQINFYTYGSTADDALPISDPGDRNCGKWDYICELLLPREDWLSYNQAITFDRAKTKIPFAIFYDIRDQFDASFNTNTQETAFVAPIHTTAANVNITLLDTSDPDLQNSMDTFRPWIEWSLWLGFVSFLWFRVKNFRP